MSPENETPPAGEGDWPEREAVLEVLHDLEISMRAVLAKPEDETRWPHAKYHADKAKRILSRLTKEGE